MIGRRFTTERIRVERRKQFLLTWALLLFLVLSCVFLLSQLSHLKELSIDRVSIRGTMTVSRTEIFNLVAPHLEGSYLRLFSKRNVLLVRTHEIEKELETLYPRFEKVNVSRRGFDVLVVNVRERDPFGIWCDDSNDCYFLDRTGFVYAPAPTFVSGTTFVRYGGGMTSSSTPAGSRFVFEEEFKTLNTLFDDLEEKNLHTSRADLKDKSLELLVRPDITSGIGEVATFSLFLTASSTYTQALSDLSVILESPDFKLDVPDLAFLDYIDLRYGNKVFYKKKDTVSVE